jgi:general secretion pathway protein G
MLNKTKGFSLIELVIAMTIIATLSAALWGNFFSSIIKGRDSRRKQDLESVAKALELYYSDFRAYPTAMPAWGGSFAHPTKATVIYMQKLPTDPSFPKYTYCYTSDTNGTYYKLYANLENTSDPKLLPTLVPCNSVNYNYGISSSNTIP